MLLHHDMAAAPAHLKKAMLGENTADLRAGEDTQFTQSRPQAE